MIRECELPHHVFKMILKLGGSTIVLKHALSVTSHLSLPNSLPPPPPV